MRIPVASLKMSAFVVWCLILVPPQALLLLIHRGKGAYMLPSIWQRGICLIFNIKVRRTGAPHTASQAIYVGNHLSYLDIPALGSLLKASFVAKNDVASWPVFGFLSRMQQTAFISRSAKDAAEEKNALGRMMEEGKSLIIFPEGTSTDGRSVLPFKSSLFAMALKNANADLLVQPFTLSLDTVEGRPPSTQDERDLYAWHRDMTTELPAHLWSFALSKGACVTLHFHPPVRACDYQDRKILAKTCHDAVSGGLQRQNQRAA